MSNLCLPQNKYRKIKKGTRDLNPNTKTSRSTYPKRKPSNISQQKKIGKLKKESALQERTEICTDEAEIGEDHLKNEAVL